MVSVGVVSRVGKTGVVFIEQGAKVRQNCERVVDEGLLPDIRAKT